MGGPGSGRRGSRNPERDREMASLRSEGLTLAEIGRRFGLTRQAVKIALDRQGYVGPVKSRKQRVGFADLTPEQRQANARKGGQAAQARGKAHRFDSEGAIVAGRKGGRVAAERGVAHRWTSEEAAEAGRKGARARWRREGGSDAPGG